MMKKLLSLLLALMMLVPLLPVSASAASNPSEVLQYGTVDAAMDAYAQKAMKAYQSKFTRMTTDGVLAFRNTVDEVYGRESHDDEPNWLMENLVTLGFTVTENDNVWTLSKNQIELDLKYLLMLAQMDALPFEDAVKQVQSYMPEYNLGMATLGLAADVFTNLLGAKLTDMVKADSLMYSLDFLSAGDKLRNGGFFSKTLAKALDFTVIKYGDIYSTATSLGEVAKNLSAYTQNDPALLNLTNSYNEALSGASLLAAMQPGVSHRELQTACSMLSDAYTAFLTELDKLGSDPDAHDKLQDEDYLSDRFDQLLTRELDGYFSGVDAVTSTAAAALTIIDVWQGGWGNLILKGGTNVLGEAVLGTTSTYTHFHAMLTLDRMYAALESATKSSSSWKEQVAYARNIQRLCNIALLGETHIYQLTTEDIGAGRKLWNMLEYAITGEDQLAQNLAWYEQRLEYLHGVYNAAQEYIDSLYEHYDKLCLESESLPSLLGYEGQLTSTIAGEIIQDKWFALPDGSGPDLENPNPDADKPVDGITVYLMSGDEVIAEDATNAEGHYTLTYPVLAVQGLPLTLVIGDTEQDDYLVKEDVSSPQHRTTAFRSAYRWNADTETLGEESAAEAGFILPYADDYFLIPGYEYNHNLALASLGLSAAAMSDPDADFHWTSSGVSGRDGNIRAAWGSLGYQVVASSGYGGNLNALNDGPAYTIATKTFEDPDDRTDGIVPKTYRVVGVAIRGDVDAAELAHTLMAAGDGSAYAGNVRNAAMEILPALERVVNSGSADVPTKVWITGFSRGGAIAAQLADLVCLRTSLYSAIDDLYAYTFAAPGGSKGDYSVRSDGSVFNIVYEADPIATGLLEATRYRYDNPGDSLSFGTDEAGSGRYRIASAFHLLTGSGGYDPLNYAADPTVRTLLSDVDEAESDTLYVRELQPLLTAILQMSFLRGSQGEDFRTLSLQDKHEQTIDITGMNQVVLNSTSTADDTLHTSSIDAMLEQAITGSAGAFFAALPEDVQENLTAYFGDVLRLAAKNSGQGSAYQLPADMAEIFLPLVLTLSDDFSSPTSLYSCLYAHHPEIYMAWMLGQGSVALFDKDVPKVFNTPILPVDKNLLGTVIDAESRKPLVNIPVHIVGGFGEDAVDRTLYTDEEGKWDTFVKPTADYTVTFELPGYYPKETRVYQSELLINTLSNHAGVPVYQTQLEIDKVEMETELQALEHDSIVITTTTRYEEGDYYWAEIEHPYVYSTKNPALYSIVESNIGPTFDKLNAEVSKNAVSSHNGCAWDLRFHEEDWLYMSTAYATDDVLSLTIHSGGFYCGIGHNTNNRIGYTFDIATGKRLVLDDILDPANPNAKQELQAQITQACKESSRPYDLSQAYSASQIYKSVSKQETCYTWYMVNDGVEMTVPTLIGGGQDSIFIPYTRLEGIIKPEYLPAENIGSATVKAVRRENLLDDYDGQLIYNNNGESTTGVQLDGLTTHIWIDDRAYNPNLARGKYFYGYKVKDVTVMLPEHEGSAGVVWTDYLGDHFADLSALPEPVEEEPIPDEDEYLP